MCRDLPQDRFPDSRFERRAYSRKFKANTIDDVRVFDHKFFKVPSREATFMDPQQRLGLQVTYQALESADYFSWDTTDIEQDMGCYWATCTNEYAENVACHPPSAFSLTGSIRPFIAGKISHHFGWTGPAIMYDTACAASGTAIHQACRAVATGECSTAVAGATNIFVSPDTFQNLACGHFTSPTGESKSFDTAADGYCRGEGVAVVVLKKLSMALRDGDPIKGVIASTAVNQNANEFSITLPHGPSQMNLYRKALRLAGLTAQDISYVEAHGTGTPVGDPIEVESIRGVFGHASHHGKTYLGSLKGNIGHTEATSGISGLIKVMLMMQKEAIPPQATFNTLNPAIAPLEPNNIEIPTSKVPWTNKFKAACVNNYGASGTNAVMVVLPPPKVIAPLESSTSKLSPIAAYPVSITAFSPSSLASYCSSLLAFINKSGKDKNDLTKDICYHLSRRKNPNLAYSLCGTVSSRQELESLLISTISTEPPKKENKRQPVVLLFGGQTGKLASVSRAFYDSATVFRKHLNDCDATLQTLGVQSIFPAIFESCPHDDVVLLHSILFSTQYASAMAWLDCGLKPARLIGHSFGQLTALCVSGVLSLHDSLRLVTQRARLIGEQWGEDPGSMIAIEADLDRVLDLLTQHADLDLEIACYNGPQSFVLAGSTSSVDNLESSLKSSPQSLRWKRLQVTNAFHSPLAENLVQSLREICEGLDFQDPKIPLETCSKDRTWQQVTPNLVAYHTREPVFFHQAVERISEQLGPCTWLEAGLGSGLPLLRRCLGMRESAHNMKSLNMDSATSFESLAEATTSLWKLGLDIRFWPFHKSQQHQYRILNLPPYQFDKAYHWLDWKDLSTPEVLVQHPEPEQRPLLRLIRKTTSGGDFCINTQCESWQTIVSQHQVLGCSVCALSSLLDLVSKAINTIQDTPAQTALIYNIQDLVTQSPIPAESESGLNLTIENANHPQSWKFVVTDASNSRNAYASGTISAPSASNESHERDFARFQRLVDITQIKNLTDDPEADSVKGKAVYNKSLTNLFQVPKSSQVVKEVSAKGSTAAGYLITVSNNQFVAVENFIQVPLICLNSLQYRQDDDIYINTSIGQATYKHPFDLQSDTKTSWSLYLKFSGLESPETTCDIFVFGQNHQLSMVILDVTFTRVQIGSLRQGLGNPLACPKLTTSHYLGATETLEYTEPPAIQTQTPDPPQLIERTTTHSTNLPDLAQALFDLLVRVADVDSDALHKDVLIGDLGVDSLMGMEVVDEINNFFSINIDVSEFMAVTDVGSLCELIAKRTSSFFYNSEPESKTESDMSGGLLTPATSNTKPLSDKEDSQAVSTGGSLHSALEAFDIIRDEFEVFAKETGCDKFWSEVYPPQMRLIVAYITEAFTKLGCDLSSVKTDEKIPDIPYLPKYDKLMVRLMRALHDDGLVTQVENDWIRTTKPVSAELSAAERFDQIMVEFPQFASEHKLLHTAGSKLNECLSGQSNPLTLLFGSPEKRKMMADQYLVAPIQSSVSRQLASFIRKCFNSQRTQQVVRVLEIGGGTCGTTLHVVNAFAQVGIPVEYTFSDISPSFVTAAKSKLAEHKFVKFRTLDITEYPSPGLSGYYDMIIATNVIHATPNACESARHARQMLRPGGFLTLVEYTCTYYHLDLIFGQLDGWWAFDDGREHAIMDEIEWKSTLKRAGFGGIECTGGKSRESRILRIFLAY
jgi:acyl transferase domain-containing protein/acyl carrier protein